MSIFGSPFWAARKPVPPPPAPIYGPQAERVMAFWLTRQLKGGLNSSPFSDDQYTLDAEKAFNWMNDPSEDSRLRRRVHMISLWRLPDGRCAKWDPSARAVPTVVLI